MEYSTEAKSDELTALLLLLDGVGAFVGKSILPLQSLFQRLEIVHVFKERSCYYLLVSLSLLLLVWA